MQLDGRTVGETIREVYDGNFLTGNAINRGKLCFKFIDPLVDCHEVGIEGSNVLNFFQTISSAVFLLKGKKGSHLVSTSPQDELRVQREPQPCSTA